MKNLISLIMIQGANAVLPIIIFPLILKRLGEKIYSQIVLSEAISLIILSIVIFSFEIDGIIRISKINSKNTIKMSKIFSEILLIRIAIATIITISLFFLYKIDQSNFTLLILLWMTIPVSFSLQSSWIYIAIQKNTFNAINVVLSRAVCVLAIFYVTEKPENYLLIPLAIGIPFLISGIISLLYLHTVLHIKLVRTTKRNMFKALKNGKEIFAGNIAVNFYRDSNILIGGLIGLTSSQLTIYSIAEKTVKALQAISRPLNQYFTPLVVRKLKNQSTTDMNSFNLILSETKLQIKLLTIAICLLMILIHIYTQEITTFFSLEIYNSLPIVTIIMLPSIIFGVANYMFGSVGLNTLGKNKSYMNKIVATGFFSLLLSPIMIYFFKIHGAGLTFLFSELLLFFLIVKEFINKNTNTKPEFTSH